MKLTRLKHWQEVAILLVLYDTVTVCLSYLLVLWLRFDCIYSAIPERFLHAWAMFAPVYAVIVMVVYYRMRLYRSIWRFASYDELTRIILATAFTWIIHVAGITVFYCRMPMTYYLFGGMLQFLFAVCIRFSYRFILLLRANRGTKDAYGNGKRVMIIGAGCAAEMLLKDMKRAKEMNDVPVCMIDDNPNKLNRYVENVPVAGTRYQIAEMVEKFQIEKIYVAIPTASPKDYKEIIDICQETDCEIKSLPAMYQLANGEVTVGQMQDVNVVDLLGRDPIRVNMNEIFAHLKGKVILVTGGGGSIGSELCRQIAAHEPKQLIIFDIYENNAYDIQLELKRKYPELNLETIIGSVRDSRMVFKLFETYRPQIVYHAAAHKHVPLMEDSPCEAIKNNALGTYKTAFAAMVHGCERFVLISTDKAVNPTNIMGASKRLCEMVVQSFDSKIKEGKAHEIPQLFTHEIKKAMDTEKVSQALRETKTEFVAVRFGNVLGSNGSVIPLFKKQIAQGGPVTVTHPDIIRYFMTIPEAVSLVLQAGTYAKGGEIFVLDMGAPVKIDTLARNLIRLSGHKPDVDIKIVYSGLRPGEKLYEEKLMAEEGLKKTENELIHIGCPIPFDTEEFLQQLDELLEAAYKNREDIRELVMKVVTTYHPAEN